MINSRHSILLNFRVRHDFYADGRCKDCEVLPSAHCTKLMRGHALHFQGLKDGFDLLYEQGGQGNLPRLPLQRKERLTFYLRLRNGFFPNYTELPKPTQGAGIMYCRNLARGEGALQCEFLPQRSSRFTHLLRQGVSTVSVSDIFNQEIIVLNAIKEQENSVRVDLSGYPDGRYLLRHSLKAGGSYEEAVFVSHDTFGQSNFAALDIVVWYANTVKYEAPVTFQLDFKRKIQQWVYKVVMPDGDDNSEKYGYGIEDHSSPSEKGPYPRFSFFEPEPLLGKQGERILGFKTQTKSQGERRVALEIPRYELPKRNLQLIRYRLKGTGNDHHHRSHSEDDENDSKGKSGKDKKKEHDKKEKTQKEYHKPGEVLIASLPNPTPENPDAHIYVHI